MIANQGGSDDFRLVPVDRERPAVCGRVIEQFPARNAFFRTLANLPVFLFQITAKIRLGFAVEQGTDDCHRARCVRHVNRLVVAVMLFDFHRGMGLRCRRAADEQGNVEILSLHFLRHMDHLVERRRNQSAQADHVYLFFAGGLQYPFATDHDTEIDHLVVVAAEHDADDVLADVVYVSFHRGEQDPALAAGFSSFLFRFHERLQVRHGLFHDAGALDHLGQEHLAGAEQVADFVHAAHQRAFDHFDRPPGLQSRFLGVFLDIAVDSLDERVTKPVVHVPGAPFEIFFRRSLHRAADFPGQFHQGLGGVRRTIQDHILDGFLQRGGNAVVDRQLAGIYDTHGKTRADRVIKKHRVNRFAHGIVAAERERHVADAAGNERAGKVFTDVAATFDEIDGIVVVFLDAGGDGEHVGIENDVPRRKIEPFAQ